MAETLRGGLSLTASGFGFTSHDIGGFEVNYFDCVMGHYISYSLVPVLGAPASPHLHAMGSVRAILFTLSPPRERILPCPLELRRGGIESAREIP